MATTTYAQNNYLDDITRKIEPVLPSTPEESSASMPLPQNVPIDPAAGNIFQQIDQLNQQNAASQQQIQELEQNLKLTNDQIAVSATYGFRDASGNFHRITPKEFHPVVESIQSDGDGRYKAYVVSLDPAGDVEKGKSSRVSANNRAVAQLLGIETRNLDDDAIKRKLGEIADSKNLSAVQPSGGSLKAVFTRADGSSGEFFVPLTMMNSSSLSGRLTAGTSQNGDIGINVGGEYTTPLTQDRLASQTLQIGANVSVSSQNSGIFASAGIQNNRIDPDMLTFRGTQVKLGSGITPTGPVAEIKYSNQTTDLLTGKTENVFSGKVGVSPFAGPFVAVDADLGTVDMSAGINVLPFTRTPFPGAVSLIFTDEGEKSYWFATRDRSKVVSTQGTNNESRGSIGLGGILPIVVPIAIPGSGLMPKRQIELPEATTQALRVGDISDAIRGMNQRATDGKFSRVYDLAAPAYAERFRASIKLPKATMAVNVLPQSELASGRYNTIVTNAEKELGIKIVENGQVVASRDEIQEAVLKYIRSNNPGLANADYLNQLRTKNPELAKMSNDQIRKSIEQYALVAVEKEKIPSADELLKMGMKTSTMIPHVDEFTLKAEPRVEVITGKDGQKYLVAQVAINVGLIDKQKTEQSRANGSIDTFQDDKWVVSEQLVRVDPNRNLREQIESAASQVESNTRMYLQRAYEELDAAANRRLDLASTREDRLKGFQNLGFTLIQNKGEIGQRWNRTVSTVTAPSVV